jgi:hypothetical protein
MCAECQPSKLNPRLGSHPDMASYPRFVRSVLTLSRLAECMFLLHRRRNSGVAKVLFLPSPNCSVDYNWPRRIGWILVATPTVSLHNAADSSAQLMAHPCPSPDYIPSVNRFQELVPRKPCMHISFYHNFAGARVISS